MRPLGERDSCHSRFIKGECNRNYVLYTIYYVLTQKLYTIYYILCLRPGKRAESTCWLRRNIQDSSKGGAIETGCSDLYDVVY